MLSLTFTFLHPYHFLFIASRSAGANAPAFKGFSSKRPLSNKFNNASTNNMSTSNMMQVSGGAAGTPTNGQKGKSFRASCLLSAFLNLSWQWLCPFSKFFCVVCNQASSWNHTELNYNIATYLHFISFHVCTINQTQASHNKSGEQWRRPSVP